MSVFVTHSDGARVAIARTSAHEDALSQLDEMLPALVENQERVVVELTAVTLTSPQRVAAFLHHVAECRAQCECEVVVVAERLSARRMLHALATADDVAVVPSLAAALAPGGAAERSPDRKPDRKKVGRRPRERMVTRSLMNSLGVVPSARRGEAS